MNSYAADPIAQRLAVAYGVESWHTLDRDEQDRWRAVAAWMTFELSSGDEWHEGCVPGFEHGPGECVAVSLYRGAAEDAFEQARQRVVQGVRLLVDRGVIASDAGTAVLGRVATMEYQGPAAV